MKDKTTTCETCQGNGEVVTDWQRYLHAHDGDKGDEAVAECPTCNGEGVTDASNPEITELLPCPFCGGEASLGSAPDYKFVNCTNCGATHLLFAETQKWDGEDATEAWNRRAT